MNKEGWKYKTLGDLFDIGSSKRVYESQWRDSGVPFYRAREIVKLARDGYVDNELFIDENLFQEYSTKYGIPQSGDLMVTGVGTLGVCHVVKESDKFYFKDGNILWFKTKPGTNPYYVNYAFKSNFLRAQIENCSGATVGTFTIVRAKKTIIPVPPLSDQEAIVAELDLLSSVIEKQKKQLEELDTLAQSIFYDMFGDPVENEKGWEVLPMPEICEIIDGDRGKNYPKQDEFTPEGYCLFLNAKNVTKSGFDFQECLFVSKERDELLRKGKLQRGDMILTTRGTIGNIAIYDDYVPYDNVRINSGMVILRMKSFMNQTMFARQFQIFLSMIKQKIASGTAQPQLPISSMNRIKIILPPLPLQQSFAEKISAIEGQKAGVKAAMADTQRLFDYTMDKYFG